MFTRAMDVTTLVIVTNAKAMTTLKYVDLETPADICASIDD